MKDNIIIYSKLYHVDAICDLSSYIYIGAWYCDTKNFQISYARVLSAIEINFLTLPTTFSWLGPRHRFQKVWFSVHCHYLILTIRRGKFLNVMIRRLSTVLTETRQATCVECVSHYKLWTSKATASENYLIHLRLLTY